MVTSLSEVKSKKQVQVSRSREQNMSPLFAVSNPRKVQPLVYRGLHEENVRLKSMDGAGKHCRLPMEDMKQGKVCLEPSQELRSGESKKVMTSTGVGR